MLTTSYTEKHNTLANVMIRWICLLVFKGGTTRQVEFSGLTDISVAI